MFDDCKNSGSPVEDEITAEELYGLCGVQIQFFECPKQRFFKQDGNSLVVFSLKSQVFDICSGVTKNVTVQKNTQKRDSLGSKNFFVTEKNKNLKREGTFW